MTKAEILAGLNEDQKKPVLDYNGPCFIVAGPGSGKTHVVVSRTQYMINDGINPSTMILFTFTNKAANEIKNRVISKIGKKGEQITVGTYHSICSKILRQYANLLGFNKKFTIFDSEDSISTLKTITKGMAFDHQTVQKFISDCKNKMISPSRAMQNAKSDFDRQMSNVYQQYQNELQMQDALDFDDLIYYTIILFEHNEDVLKKINNKYQYIVADEFHDSSQRDIKLIELLGGERQNVCMILDDEQSIYGFRGADIDSVLGVDSIFPNLKYFVLRENYRSTKNIVRASRSLIAKNSNQLPKEVFTNNPEGDIVVFFEEETQAQESLRVLKLVSFLTAKYKLQYKDIAILYRMSYLSRSIEETFLKGNVPYRIVGGTPFYARKEIKDILSYVRLLSNPFDYEAFKRVINTPKRNIGDTTILKIQEYARNTYSKPISYLTACKEIDLKGKAGQGLKQFNEIMDELVANVEEDSAGKLIKKVVELTKYREMLLETEAVQKAEERLANVMELMDLAAGFDTIEEFLQNTSLDSQIDDEDDDDNRVCLQTMHSAKGLEYKAVIIVGANEGINPHWKAMDVKSIDEERRLFYVAMTRAKDYLFITRPRVVMQQGKLTRSSISRFIKEIDPKFLKKY
jgi:DNA helicase-2/ATP-dependent DNA helicase PcrA